MDVYYQQLQGMGMTIYFPVALGVVEQENKDSWVWFLQTFADDIGRLDELNLVFISNRQKVIQFTCFLRLLYI